MEEHHSILYEPFNKYVWRHAFGFDVPDHVIMALLVLAVSATVFPLASRKFDKDNPGGFQHFLEVIVSGLKGLMEDIIGHGASQKYLYIIGGFACFIFISNIFGLFFFLQPPTGNPNECVTSSSPWWDKSFCTVPTLVIARWAEGAGPPRGV